ncbi:hypothetical protein LEP1GSC043_3761 [Leptospira weilii str. Ecochallenge]|uniref:Uncharacterized protein n=1 Tax=Leptospira weilii str. Ecochallenge TaxID=1049986 RepID=N1UHH9_9LEPT|nr:hypothetical protein LEP1GSC043_3761 [Leptospira weilii str. Ecochallenge]
MWGDRFTEDLSEFRQIYLRIQVFVGLIMLENNTLVSYAELTLFSITNAKAILYFDLKHDA